MSDNNKIYGYVRVSSTDQNEERQMVALAEAGVSEKNIFEVHYLFAPLIL